MSESEYIRKISEQAAELNHMGKVLTESEVHIRGLEGTVQRLEEQVVSHTPAQAEIRASGVGELAYKRLVERQLDEARRDIEARDKTIEHFQRKSDALNDENARLRGELAATQRIKGAGASSRLTDRHDRTGGAGMGASHGHGKGRVLAAKGNVPSGHPQAPPTIARYNELRKVLKETKERFAATKDALVETETERDEALCEVGQLQAALSLNVPVSQLRGQMELLQKLTFLRKEVTDMRAGLDGVALEAPPAAHGHPHGDGHGYGREDMSGVDADDLRLERLTRIKFMRETDYDHMPEADPEVRLARLTNDHRCLLDFMHKDYEQAAHLAGELDVTLAEVVTLKEQQCVSDGSLEAAKRVMDEAAHETQTLQMQVDEGRVKLRRMELVLGKAQEARDRFGEALDVQAEELEVTCGRVRTVEAALEESERAHEAAAEEAERAAARADALEREMDRLAEDLGGVRAVSSRSSRLVDAGPSSVTDDGGGGGDGDHVPMVERRSRVVGESASHSNSESMLERRIREAEEDLLKEHGTGTGATEDAATPVKGAAGAAEDDYHSYLTSRSVHAAAAAAASSAAVGMAGVAVDGSLVTTETLEELRQVDGAVGALSEALLCFLRRRDETEGAGPAVASGGGGTVNKDHSWVELKELEGLSGPLSQLLGELRRDWKGARAAAEAADTRARHAAERSDVVERAAGAAGCEGAAALEAAQQQLQSQADECSALQSDCSRYMQAANELKVVADLLVNACEGLDVPDAAAALTALRAAGQEVRVAHHRAPALSPMRAVAHGHYAFGSSVKAGSRFDGDSLRSPRSPVRSSASASKGRGRGPESRTPSRSPIRCGAGGGSRFPTPDRGLDVSDLRTDRPDTRVTDPAYAGAGAGGVMTMAVVRPAALGEAMRVVIKRMARDAQQATASRDECRTLRRRLTEAEMRMEMHQREVGALKMAYDSTQDVTFLQADTAKGEAEELRRALEETLAMLERQNVMQVTLEAKYEAAVRDGSDRNAQVHVGLQREGASHIALHQVLSRVVDVSEALAEGSAGRAVSADSRGRLRSLYLPAVSVSPYDLVRFAEKLLVVLLGCLDVEGLGCKLPLAPAVSYAAPRNAVSAAFDQSAVLPASQRYLSTSARNGQRGGDMSSDAVPPTPPPITVDTSASPRSTSASAGAGTGGPKPGSRAALPEPSPRTPIVSGGSSGSGSGSGSCGDGTPSGPSATDIALGVRSAERDGVGAHTIANKKLENARAKFAKMRGKDSAVASTMQKVQLSPTRAESPVDGDGAKGGGEKSKN